MTILTDDELKAVRERCAEDNDDILSVSADRRALLRHIDALTAKLRVAVEALRMMTDDQCDWYTSAVELANMDGHERKAKIDEALAAIGPLPLPTPLPGEGE